MLLADLLDHLARRFPDGATVLSAEIAVSGHNHPRGLVETISFEAEEADDEGDPDDDEEDEADHRTRLRLVT